MTSTLPPCRRNKTAVIFIHGQGEQRPMEDLRQLVDSIWSCDPKLDEIAESRQIWSTPDPHSDTLESRRLTTDTFKTATREDRGRSVDFFEFYWAHKMTGNRALDVIQWAFEKWPRQSPINVAPAMLLLKLIPSFLLACLLLLAAAPVSELILRLSDPVMPDFGPLSGDPDRPLPQLMIGWAQSAGAWWHGALSRIGVWGLLAPLALMTAAWLISGRAPKKPSIAAPYVPLLWIVPGLSLFWLLMTIGWLIVASRMQGADVHAHWHEAGEAVVLIGIVVGLVAALTSATTLPFVRQVMGDSSRYLRPAPDNIAARAAIRDAGVKLLERVHAEIDYDRVILVAHSLGSIIAYDLLTQFWARQARSWFAEDGLEAIFDEVEEAGRALYAAELKLPPKPGLFALLFAPPDRGERARAFSELAQAQARFIAAQRRFCAQLAARPERPWLITDLVTLGSPLTYAKFVLADSDAEFDVRRTSLLELPSCPPLPFTRIEGEAPGFTFPRRRGVSGATGRSPRHDAVFAATRWTNLYFPSIGGFWGDMIGGPIAPMFGPGVKDIAVQGRGVSGFLHNGYWLRGAGAVDDPEHIQTLRAAINLSEPVPEPAGPCA
jgi:hypothetical protein